MPGLPRPSQLLRTPARAMTAVTTVAALGLAGVLVGLPVAGPAAADVVVQEVYERPADGVFPVEGHGWGHGRGMSQWGAQGAATLGLSADTITATYYPGTTRTLLPDRPIKVLLNNDGPGGSGLTDTDVAMAAGLTATDEGTGATLALPAGPSRYRVVAGLGSAERLQRLDGSVWTDTNYLGRVDATGPISFAGPTFLRLALPDGSQRDYRGRLRAVRSAAGVVSIDELRLEDYLLGVVPREAFSSWLPEALKAQAIAARSYSAYKRDHAPSGSYDICDTTSCQVFDGSRTISAAGTVTEIEVASTSQAVAATSTVVRAFGGKAIFAEFSSSNGGWSTAGGQPYLVAQRDDWDGVAPNSVHNWTGRVGAADLERSFPTVGTLRRIRVTARDGNGDWGGRVSAVVLEGVAANGSATSVPTTGAGGYSAAPWPARSDGLRSTWWHVTGVSTPQMVKLVQAMYLDVLGRPADDGGLRGWSSQLASGQLTAQSLALSLGRSPENTGRVVTRLYAEVLARAPDPVGLAGWSAVLQSDPTQVAAVAAAIYGSEEHLAVNGHDARRWVTALYRQVLLRDPDPAELAGWVGQVPTLGRTAIARGFYDSQESSQRRVRTLYVNLLGRSVDPTGLAGWPAVVAQQGDITLASYLASSAEYVARAQLR